RLIAVSQATADDLRRFYRVSPGRMAVIQSGVHETFRPPTTNEMARVRDRYGLPSAYFLYLGRAHPRKNLPLLLAAFQAARRSGLTAGLVLAGPGHQPPAGDGVHVLGYVPREDLPALDGAALAPALHPPFDGFGF